MRSKKDKKPHNPAGDGSEEIPVLQELRRRLSDPGPLREPFDEAQGRLWAQRFRRLAEAIAQVGDLPCEECLAMLDVYVDDELAGHDARQYYPRLWQHLQRCDDCREAHDLLFETLAQERPGQLPPLPRSKPLRLSFLEPPALDALWTKRLRSRLAGAPFSLTFTLMPTLLRGLLSPSRAQLVPTRGVGPSPQPRVLVSDTVSLEDGPVGVEVIAIPDPQNPDRLHLRATIAGVASLPANLWAVLTWGDEVRAGAVDDQGQVDLGEVSLVALQEALETGDGVFEITFETRIVE